MLATVLHGPRDVRVENVPDPSIVEPTDAIIRLAATCICGSDLWPYRGVDTYDDPAPMGHEYVGIVEEVGDDVTTIKPGQFVIGSFFASDNTCAICRAGYQSSCVNRVGIGSIGTQAEYARIPLADGTLVPTPDVPSAELVPSFLAASDVLGTGWFAAVAAEVGFVGVTHDVSLPGDEMFMSHVHLHGRPAPVRRFLPEHVKLISDGTIEPGKVFDLTLPLEEAAEGYKAMDERRAIKTLLETP